LEDGHLFLFSHFFCSQAYGLAGGGFRELFELYAFAVHILILICLCISGYHSGYIGRLILMKRHLSKTFKYLLLLFFAFFMVRRLYLVLILGFVIVNVGDSVIFMPDFLLFVRH
jgi:hypothetical protein